MSWATVQNEAGREKSPGGVLTLILTLLVTTLRHSNYTSQERLRIGWRWSLCQLPARRYPTNQEKKARHGPVAPGHQPGAATSHSPHPTRTSDPQGTPCCSLRSRCGISEGSSTAMPATLGTRRNTWIAQRLNPVELLPTAVTTASLPQHIEPGIANYEVEESRLQSPAIDGSLKLCSLSHLHSAAPCLIFSGLLPDSI